MWKVEYWTPKNYQYIGRHTGYMWSGRKYPVRLSKTHKNIMIKTEEGKWVVLDVYKPRELLEQMFNFVDYELCQTFKHSTECEVGFANSEIEAHYQRMKSSCGEILKQGLNGEFILRDIVTWKF